MNENSREVESPGPTKEGMFIKELSEGVATSHYHSAGLPGDFSWHIVGDDPSQKAWGRLKDPAPKPEILFLSQLSNVYVALLSAFRMSPGEGELGAASFSVSFSLTHVSLCRRGSWCRRAKWMSDPVLGAWGWSGMLLLTQSSCFGSCCASLFSQARDAGQACHCEETQACGLSPGKVTLGYTLESPGAAFKS